MGYSEKNVASVTILIWLALFSRVFRPAAAADFDYKLALHKAILFLEAQRSGKLTNSRVPWRGDSALDDGKLANVDLVGGYYDAGDNVKFGMPMAFTVTTLSWGAIFYKSELEKAGELQNVLSAIKWGSDYFLKAAAKPNVLWVQVGDPNADHRCWVRPENMKTARTLYKIDKNTPGSEIAAETAAAMAASSIVFRSSNQTYARRLLNKAKLLFEFAKTHKGTYDGECPFYCSFSGYNDELLWAASWLYEATMRETYFKYITQEAVSASVDEFNWDLKYAGVQVLLSKWYLRGKKSLEKFKLQGDEYICSVLPCSLYKQVNLSPGGLIYLRDGANTQYATGAALLFSIYSDVLAANNATVTCGQQQINPSQLMMFAKQQMDYLLGDNPEKMSYMVGFGTISPTQAHHRGSSVPVLPPGEKVDCPLSFVEWFHKDAPNPNELTGAIVGGPDRNDRFIDKRWDSTKLEPTTYTNSLAIGVLAKLANSHMY